jgi:hypothetical protein
LYRRRPEPGDTTGHVVCRVCGRSWATTPEQDELLAELFDHHEPQEAD